MKILNFLNRVNPFSKKENINLSTTIQSVLYTLMGMLGFSEATGVEIVDAGMLIVSGIGILWQAWRSYRHKLTTEDEEILSKKKAA